jgi:C4-dicarboxylate-specific signal transduction histidine kinase
MEKSAAQAARASEIVQRIARFVKREQVAHAPIELNAVIQDVSSLPMIDSGHSGAPRIVPELQLAKNLPSVVGDRVQIEQVLVNLIRNGMEAMADAAPANRRLIVRSGVVDGNVQVSVQDRGHGITDEVLTQLFDPFFTTKASGLGLGLSISRSIMEAHRGHLWAENNADGGATFYFSIPIVVEETSS